MFTQTVHQRCIYFWSEWGGEQKQEEMAVQEDVMSLTSANGKSLIPILWHSTVMSLLEGHPDVIFCVPDK